MAVPLSRERNDLRQYDDLHNVWWDERGPFAMLQWIAEARGKLIPPAAHSGAVLLDMACGGGLMAPYVKAKNYHHIGVDMSVSALDVAAERGISVVRGDVTALPFADSSADIVCAGEILEHVENLRGAIAESARVLRPGGTIVIDTIANTAIARLLAITIAERIPGGAPPGIHDHRLFVNRHFLIDEYSKHGVALQIRGLRPSFLSIAAWATQLRPRGHMVPTKLTNVLFQAWGQKQ